MDEYDLLKAIDKHQSMIHDLFPGRFPSVQTIKELFEGGNCLVLRNDHLPYLQTAFFGEQICELEIVGLTRVYFCKIWDHLPELQEDVDEEGNVSLVEPDYLPGDYLKKTSHLILSPLEPGIGNYHILDSRRIILRTFSSTGTTGIEFGISFVGRIHVRDRICLHFSFPNIAVISSGVRSFRATVSGKFKVEVQIPIIKKEEPYLATMHNISTKGMAFLVEKNHQEHLRIGRKFEIEILAPKHKPIKVVCDIRHISKVRDKKIIQYRCGVRFDLTSRSLANDIERLMTKVQRIHLKELSEKSFDAGFDFIRD